MIDHFGGVAQKRLPLGAELQIALNLIPAHTWYAVPSGALTFLNERASDYIGLPKDHPLRFGIDTGAEWDSHIPLLHPDDHEETRRVWSTCLHTGCAGQVSFRVRHAEGAYRWFLSRAEPVRASDGTLVYWIGVNLDIEDRKQAEFYLAEGQRLAHMGNSVFARELAVVVLPGDIALLQKLARGAAAVVLPLVVGAATGHILYGAYMALIALPAGPFHGETRSRVAVLASLGMSHSTFGAALTHANSIALDQRPSH